MNQIFPNYLDDEGVEIRVFQAANNVGNKGLNFKNFWRQKNLEIMSEIFPNFFGD